jgi:hypothetical protein
VAELGVRQSAEVAQASWPDDRAWCVAAEIDLAWTYVGGSVTLINDVLASPRLEAQPASLDDDFRQRLPEWLAPHYKMTSMKFWAPAPLRCTPGERP